MPIYWNHMKSHKFGSRWSIKWCAQPPDFVWKKRFIGRLAPTILYEGILEGMNLSGKLRIFSWLTRSRALSAEHSTVFQTMPAALANLRIRELMPLPVRMWFTIYHISQLSGATKQLEIHLHIGCRWEVLLSPEGRTLAKLCSQLETDMCIMSVCACFPSRNTCYTKFRCHMWSNMCTTITCIVLP